MNNPTIKLITFVFFMIIYFSAGTGLLAQGTNHFQVFETQGIAASMGRITTVASDGPFDVLRNPATLTTQKEDNAAAAGISREAYSNFDVSTDVTIDSNQFEIAGSSFSSDFSREFYLNGGLAYTRRFTDDVSAGVALSGTMENMENKSGRTITIRTSYFPGNIRMYGDSEELEKNRTINMVCSVGYKFLNDFSVGLQTKVEYFNNKKSYEESEYSPYDETSTNSTSEYTAISPVISLGFLFKDTRQEAGLIITSGKYTWKKTSDNLKYNDLNHPQNNYKINNEKAKKGRNVEGVGIIAGYYYQIIPMIGAAAELGCILPVKYNEHSLVNSREQNNYIDAENKIENKFSYMANCGVKINPYKETTIAAGGGYRIISNESAVKEYMDSGNKIQEKNEMLFTGYLATLGLENRVLDTSKIIISMDLIFLYASGKGRHEESPASMNMKMEQKISGVFFNTGIAYVQYF